MPPIDLTGATTPLRNLYNLQPQPSTVITIDSDDLDSDYERFYSVSSASGREDSIAAARCAIVRYFQRVSGVGFLTTAGATYQKTITYLIVTQLLQLKPSTKPLTPGQRGGDSQLTEVMRRRIRRVRIIDSTSFATVLINPGIGLLRPVYGETSSRKCGCNWKGVAKRTLDG